MSNAPPVPDMLERRATPHINNALRFLAVLGSHNYSGVRMSGSSVDRRLNMWDRFSRRSISEAQLVLCRTSNDGLPTHVGATGGLPASVTTIRHWQASCQWHPDGWPISLEMGRASSSLVRVPHG